MTHSGRSLPHRQQSSEPRRRRSTLRLLNKGVATTTPQCLWVSRLTTRAFTSALFSWQKGASKRPRKSIWNVERCDMTQIALTHCLAGQDFHWSLPHRHCSTSLHLLSTPHPDALSTRPRGLLLCQHEGFRPHATCGMLAVATIFHRSTGCGCRNTWSLQKSGLHSICPGCPRWPGARKKNAEPSKKKKARARGESYKKWWHQRRGARASPYPTSTPTGAEALWAGGTRRRKACGASVAWPH